LIPLEKRFDGSAKTCPKLHLPGNRAFHQFAGYAGIKNKSIGELYWLTHVSMVAYCYLEFWGEMWGTLLFRSGQTLFALFARF
jgi:hypothetical protein